MAEIIGYQGTIYQQSILSSAWDRTGWTILTGAKDATIGDETEGVERTARDNAGWKSFLAGLRDMPVDLEVAWNPDNAVLIAIQTAYEAKAAIALLFTDGVVADAAAAGGNFIITTFTQNQPIGGHVTVSITAMPNTFMATIAHT